MVMRYVMLAVSIALLMPCAALGAPKITAVRAQIPPVMDGKLDDACWKNASPISGFKVYQTDIPATPQSIGYIAYDDTHLYIAMKCMMAKGIFNDALKFAAVADINADFSKYSFPIGPGYVQYEPTSTPPAATLIMPLANCYSHKLGKFDAVHKYWINYHWRIFRARGKTAKITVTDWQSKTKPGRCLPVFQTLAEAAVLACGGRCLGIPDDRVSYYCGPTIPCVM
jgi:hypothetical protein